MGEAGRITRETRVRVVIVGYGENLNLDSKKDIKLILQNNKMPIASAKPESKLSKTRSSKKEQL